MLLSRHTSSQGILAADGKTVEKLVELPQLIIEQHPIYLDPSSWYIAKYSEYRALHDNGRSRCGHWAGTDSGCIQAVVDSSLLGSWYVLIPHRVRGSSDAVLGQETMQLPCSSGTIAEMTVLNAMSCRSTEQAAGTANQQSESWTTPSGLDLEYLDPCAGTGAVLHLPCLLTPCCSSLQAWGQGDTAHELVSWH